MRVILLLLPRVEVMDFAGPLQVFLEANRHGARFEVLICAPEAELPTAQALWRSRLGPLPDPQPGDLVLVPGGPMATRMQVSRDLLAWQRRAAKTGARMGSVCTGAFVLGAAGLLDGRACTTHWSRVADLRRRFPKTKVLEDRLYVADGHLHPGVHRVQDWIAAHPEQPAALPDLAELAAMSVRSLTRQFREATGLSVKAARPRCAWSGPETCCGIPS